MFLLKIFCVFLAQDILKDAIDNNFTSVTEIPYFEGDFWPNILEECIKELEQEEVEKRLREEEEAAADTEDLEPMDRDSTEVGGRFRVPRNKLNGTLQMCMYDITIDN